MLPQLCSLTLVDFHANIVGTNCFGLATALVAGALLGRQLGCVGAHSTMLIVPADVELISARAGPSRWLVNPAQWAHGANVAPVSGHLIARAGKACAGNRGWQFDVSRRELRTPPPCNPLQANLVTHTKQRGGTFRAASVLLFAKRRHAPNRTIPAWRIKKCSVPATCGYKSA